MTPEPRQRVLVAEAAGEAAARVVARVSEIVDEAGRPVGTLGPFESVDDADAAGEVLREGVAWLRGEGAGRVVGPMSGDTWHAYRLNLGPYDAPPFLLEPWNPPFYPRLWETAGFVADADYLSLRVDRVADAADALAPRAEAALAAGYRLEPADLHDLAATLDRIYDLTVRAFPGAHLYTPIDRAAFHALYAGVQPLLAPGLVQLAVAPDGADAGFVFAYPDRATPAVCIKTLAVLPEHRRSGLAAALMRRIYQTTLATNHPAALLCLIHEANPSQHLDAGLGHVFRRYRLYHCAEPPL